MGTPWIVTKSEVAGQLAKTLGTSVEELDRLSDRGINGQIFFRDFVNDTPFKGRVVDFSSGFDSNPCVFSFFSDNGDGKIGKGDLFVYAAQDYYKQYKSSQDYSKAYRFAKLFEDKSSLPADMAKILRAAETLKGKPFQSLASGLDRVCSKK